MTTATARAFFMRTERLGFGHWSADDFPLALELWGDARVTRLFGGPFDEAQVRARLDREISNQREFGFQYWPLFRLSDGAHVGCAGLRPFDRPDTLETGFHLRPSYWRDGIGGEAARAIVHHAFHGLRVGALFAGHHPRNEASRALLIRLGFECIGTEFYEPTGEMHPSYLLRNQGAAENRIG